jgi:Fe-S-cluster containining protein
MAAETRDAEDSAEYLTASADFSVAGRKLHLEMNVPTGLTRTTDLLPLFRSLTDSFVTMAVEDAQAEGATISCKKGCGACCRQLVPISEVEAIRLRDMVNDMPEPRKSEILARFASARERLQESGLLEMLIERERLQKDEIIPFSMNYFHQGIACPFLEAESCSIYEERPLACREYLVTSPAEHCANPTAETISCVEIPAKVSRVLRCFNVDKSRFQNSWVPLILALEWADAQPDEVPQRSGTDLVRELFSRLTGGDIPDSPI